MEQTPSLKWTQSLTPQTTLPLIRTQQTRSMRYPLNLLKSRKSMTTPKRWCKQSKTNSTLSKKRLQTLKSRKSWLRRQWSQTSRDYRSSGRQSRRLRPKLMRNDWPSVLTPTCYTEWSRTTLRPKSSQPSLSRVWRIKRRSLVLKRRSSAGRKKTDYNPRASSII